MKKQLKSDSGFALGLVLIFVLGVGAVLGSVMMITQLSADAQGRGVDQLTVANKISVAVADVIQEYDQGAAQRYALQMAHDAPNCGLSNQIEDISITCEALPSGDPSNVQTDRVILRSPNGIVVERTFTVTQDQVSQVQHVSVAGK